MLALAAAFVLSTSPAQPGPTAEVEPSAAAAPAGTDDAGRTALGAHAASLQTAVARARLGLAAPRKALPPGPGPHIVTLELRLAASGAVRGLTFGPSTVPKPARDLALTLILGAEPLPPPDPLLFEARSEIACLARLALSVEKKKLKAVPVVACMGADGALGPIAGSVDDEAADASGALFAGWAREAAGDLAGAIGCYERAHAAAADWDLAARAKGLVLVQQKRGGAAIPLLRTYVASRAGPADAFAFGREIERFEREQEARAAEFTRPRPRLGKEELLLGVRKGYPLLEPCLARAREKQLLALGTDTLELTFRINKDGGVSAARLEAPLALLMTEAAECLERTVLAWRFPPYTEGSEITAKGLPIKVRGSSPPRPASDAVDAAPAEPEPIEEPMFATCERAPEEIAGYVSSRSGRLAACLQAERRRNPNGWPETLPVSFVVDAQGPIRGVSANHRYFRDGPVADCISQALGGRLPPVGGADCPAELPIDLRAFIGRR